MLKKLLCVLGLAAACAAVQASAQAVVCEKPGVTKSITLPEVTLQAGEKALLRLRVYAYATTQAGCNYNALVKLNGSNVAGSFQGSNRIGLLRKGKTPLMLNRFQNGKLLVMFAPDADKANAMTSGNGGAFFEFDVSNLVRGKKVNTLELINCRTGKAARLEVAMQDVELVKTSAVVNNNSLMQLPMEVVAKLQDVTLPEVQTAREIDFAALPEKAGFVRVLRCQMFSYGSSGGGCNFNAQIRVNGKYLTRYTENDSERLIGRNPVFGLILGQKVREFQIFAGNNIMTIFAPNTLQADRQTADKLGSTFIFDLSDRVRGVDGNTIVFRNIRAKHPGRMDLIVQNIQIGYLDKKYLPKAQSNIPKRGAVVQNVKNGHLTLFQGKKGGFILQNSAGQKLMTETLMSVTSSGNVIFRAEDGGAALRGEQVDCRKTADGFAVTARLANGLVMERTLTLQKNQLFWREVWRNTSGKALGVPFRHRFAVIDEDIKFFVAGDGDNGAKLSSAHNPTIFLQNKKSLNGFGITAENDWTRLLIGLRADGSVADIYSNQLALQPGKSIELAFSIDSETSGKGYWAFINRLRRRWLGDKTLTAQAPFFWLNSFRRAPGKTVAEKIRNGFAHLGPAIVPATRWSRLGFDASTVLSKKYPVKADGSVDAEKFVTFEHRNFFYDEYAQQLKLFAENAPQVKFIVMTHPAMEVVYAPAADKWPYAADEIKTADGKCFNAPYYSRAHLGAPAVNAGWAVYYYVPNAGGKYAQMLTNDVLHQLEKLQGPGVYFDEFTFGASTRGYSRYDYGKSDGYSADLDNAGNVVRFKSDNAMSSTQFRKNLTARVAESGKVFYANGAPSLMSEQRIPVLFFVEGGNGYGNLATGHLTQVPLALGNYGDYRSRKGIFEAAKTALAIGTIYSPHQDCNLLLKHRNEFVCRMYPITIMEINSGTIKGKERIITAKSGTFDWQVPDGKVDLYIYDANGDWIGSVKPGLVKNGTIALQVPTGGMVIAERK